ncbi:MAG: hypothetical protein M2R45_01242 [Verrucomicrobia subdivision 3 bacterium]|nr:hypothetical protein [Limisphaerales bacterium]MCS1415113.1 hypothetical protein [Limisphaerales bacterium]
MNISTVRNLRGVLERDDAVMAGLIILEELGGLKSQNFHKEMALADDFGGDRNTLPENATSDSRGDFGRKAIHNSGGGRPRISSTCLALRISP